MSQILTIGLCDKPAAGLNAFICRQCEIALFRLFLPPLKSLARMLVDAIELMAIGQGFGKYVSSRSRNRESRCRPNVKGLGESGLIGRNVYRSTES